MKTTVDIADDLYARTKRAAALTGRPMRSLIEEGLRRVLEEAEAPAGWRMPDCSVGEPGAVNPLEALAWHELRDEIYGTR